MYRCKKVHNFISRYARHISLKEIGHAGQELISNSKIVIIGAGGLGSPVLLYLVAMGVENIHIIDGDDVDISNLQRQIIHNSYDVGKKKTFSAWQKLLDINPRVNISCHEGFVSEHNVNKIIPAKYDIVIDCSDNFATRSIVNRFCYKNKVVLISGSAIGFTGQISTFNFETGKPCYNCLYPDAIELNNDCNNGVLGSVPGIIGTIMATEAIKIIIDQNNDSLNYLIIFDSYNLHMKKVLINKDKNCSTCSL